MFVSFVSRASDLLQANGIVWVEGPSDRLYFNRWVELWSGGKLREGAHYQCVFYGGRLLAHLSATDPDFNVEDAIKILRVNRNAIVLMDSDKTDAGSPIGDTKMRITDEIQKIGGLAWITAGREVENYLPLEAIKGYVPTASRPIGQFKYMKDYLKTIGSPDVSSKFLSSKPLFAELVIPLITLENAKLVLDLDERMRDACEAIRKWNSM